MPGTEFVALRVELGPARRDARHDPPRSQAPGAPYKRHREGEPYEPAHEDAKREHHGRLDHYPAPERRDVLANIGAIRYRKQIAGRSGGFSAASVKIRCACAYSATGKGRRGVLEGVPGRGRRELQVTDIQPKPGADAAADRDDIDGPLRNLGVRKHRHAEAADEVGRAVDPAETPEDGERTRQVIDQHHGAVAVAAEVEADRGALPVDRALAVELRVDHAVAIADAADEGAGTLLADDVAVGQAVAGDDLLDYGGEPARHLAEELMPGADDLIRRVGLVARGAVGAGDGEDDQQNRREPGEKSAQSGHGFPSHTDYATRGAPGGEVDPTG